MLNENAIETHGLTKTFKSSFRSPGNGIGLFRRKETRTVKAIDNLNLEIRKGELFGLLGPNGAGKTTLVKILSTLLPPDAGTARLNGFDVVHEQMDVKKSLGTLFSVGERGFFWRLSGYRNLEFFAAIYNVPRQRRHERITEVLDLVGLEDSAFDLFQKYSGGMKRKLSLARALLPDPPVLLLDEPTTGLDAISSRHIREFVKTTLSRMQGKTVLYTTHHVEDAAQICDRVGILSSGQLIACDTPEAITSMIKKDERVCIVVENITENQIKTMQTMKSVVSLTLENGEGRPGQKQLGLELESVDSLPVIFDFLFKEKIRLVNFRREEPTLEDAFIELIKKGVKK
jgi:ABC-2 type transport system ATP-binding protein